ncbi:MAG TPA: inositol monophosphatase family protein [Fimbriimonadaceae bacterium]
MSDYADLLPKLAEITREGGRIAQEARKRLNRQIKPDGSILTNGDQEVERFLRSELCKMVDGAAVWGEEYGFSEQTPQGLWLVDPIDGTSNYAFHSPLWGVSIALLVDNQIQFGSVFLPDLNELYLSARGHGVTCNGHQLAKIEPGEIRPCELVSYNDHVLKACDKLPGKMRHAGAFVIDGCFTACQRYRGLIGIRERLYDIAPCLLFNEELGADIRYADGSPLDLSELKANIKITRPWVIFPRQSGFFLNRP